MRDNNLYRIIIIIYTEYSNSSKWGEKNSLNIQMSMNHLHLNIFSMHNHCMVVKS